MSDLLPKAITADQYRTRYFDDLVVGERFVSRWAAVSTDEMIRFAAEWDPQVQHLDPEAAAAMPLGGLIASGALTFALWNKLNLEANGDIAWIAGLGFDEFVLPNPLRPDVEVQSRSELLEARPSSSDPTRGVVVHAHGLHARDGTCVFSCRNPALVVRR